MRIINPHGIPLGYSEAKDAGRSPDMIEKDEQLKLYHERFDNLIINGLIRDMPAVKFLAALP